MFPYAIKRILGSIPTLFVLMAMTFFLLRLAPGGPFDGEQVWPPEIQANILKRYHLDEPILTQFQDWTKDLLHGDLKESFQYLGRPVTEIIGSSLPTSLYLGALAIGICLAIGIPLGGVAAWKYGTWIDETILLFAISGICLPVFLVASILILVFSLWLNWLPPALWENSASLVLPVLSLSWRPMAMVAQLTRGSIIEVLNSDFIRTARGKGLPERTIVFKHALKNSLIPVISILGPISANLVTGSFVVELIFQIPGMGKHFVQAVLNRDYPLVMGVTLTYGVILVACNLGVDLLYFWIDPRMDTEVLSGDEA